MRAAIAADPNNCTEYMSLISRFDSVPAMLSPLGLSAHPLLEFEGRVRYSTARQIIYHTDIDSQYMKLKEAQKQIQKSRARMAATENLRPAPDPWEDALMREPKSIEDSLKRGAAWSHLRSVAQAGDFLATPACHSVRAFESLQHRLAPARAAPQSLCALQEADIVEEIEFDDNRASSSGHF